jgi:hypothetical protein
MSRSIYSSTLIDVKFDESVVSDLTCMYNIARLTVKKAALQKRPKLLIQIQSDIETFGHSIDFDLKVRRASKQAIEFAIPFWKRVTDHHEFRAKLCDYFRERMASNWYQEERSTLQNTILVLVKTRTFREAACAHFSEKRGAVAALEVLRRIDTEWVCGV